MRAFNEGKDKPVKSYKVICFIFLIWLTASSHCYSNYFSFFTPFGEKIFNTTKDFFAQESLHSITNTELSLTEERDYNSQTKGILPPKYALCTGIILVSLFFLIYLFLRIRRNEKRFSILKKQNKELSALLSNTLKNSVPSNSCLFKTDIPPSRLMDSIFVKTRERMVKILLKDILYIQADRNYCSLHTKDKEFLVVMPLKELFEKLPPGYFLRIHRSFVINLPHIQEIGTGHVVIEGKSLPLSKSLKEDLLKHLQTLWWIKCLPQNRRENKTMYPDTIRTYLS